MKIRNAVFAFLIAVFAGIQARAADVPSITNDPLTFTTTVGAGVNYSINASNSPTSYFASPLPLGLTISPSTGIISGAAALVGTTKVVIGATNSAGTGIATLTIVTTESDVPVVTNDPLFAGGTVGVRFSFVLTSSGGNTSYSASNLPPGLTLSNSNGAITGIPTTAGTTLVPVTVNNGAGSSTVTLTISIGLADPPPAYVPPPELKLPTTAVIASSGTPFNFQIVATNSPTSYSATGLPSGLTLNTSTGVITGSPTAAGAFPVVITATNVTATAGGTFTISVPIIAPVITGPSTASGTAGTAFPTLQIAATGSPTSYAASGLPPGLSLNTTAGTISGTPTTAGTFVVTLTASNSAGSNSRQLTITIAPQPVAPTITSATTLSARVGEAIPTYTITAAGAPTSFFAIGLPPGISLNLTTGVITGTPTSAGTFAATIGAANAIGTGTATLTITVQGSRIVNFSTRALSGPGDQTLVMGFVVRGNGKSLLVRGIGPALSGFGVANALADPNLTVFSGSATVASNDDWGTATPGGATPADLAAAALRVGGFALPTGSKDSALITTLNNGPYSTSLVRANATTGIALTEVYDLDTTSDSRLVNVSARINVSAGEGTLIAGLSIAGSGPKPVLIRGVGPTLTQFGVTGVLADPQITVFNGSTVIASNDNWNSDQQVAAAAVQVGAFALPAGSRDAALLVTLQPGSYTVQITGVGNTTGVALIEIYDTQ